VEQREVVERLAADLQVVARIAAAAAGGAGDGAALSARRKSGAAGSMVQSVPRTQDEYSQSPRFGAEAFAYLRDRAADMEGQFIFLDVKSLPRAGLHYLKNTLTAILQDALSFCEWYQEPGCCEQMPCARSRYLAEGRGRVLVRMSKSHDFDLADPDYPTNAITRRVILVRDPLFILTSWWTLDLLTRHAGALRQGGIDPVALFYRHDKSILAAAYQLISGATVGDDAENVRAWVQRRKAYIIGFVKKWSAASTGPRVQFTRFAQYDETPQIAAEIVEELSERLSDDEEARLSAFVSTPESRFTPRRDAFLGPTEEISDFLKRHSAVFETAARELIASDETGILERTSKL
jgi:hypothetical protein